MYGIKYYIFEDQKLNNLLFNNSLEIDKIIIKRTYKVMTLTNRVI